MRNEDRYRAALVALRDGQWETAARELLTIAATAPEYRDIHRVLGVLRQTRAVPYWCAAFDVARTSGDRELARTALRELQRLDPEHPRLDAMRKSLESGMFTNAPEASPTAFHTDQTQPDAITIQPDGLEHASATPSRTPAAELAEEPEAEFGTDPIRKLELDPLTELLLTNEWIEEASQPVRPALPVQPAVPAVPDQPEEAHAGPEPAKNHELAMASTEMVAEDPFGTTPLREEMPDLPSIAPETSRTMAIPIPPTPPEVLPPTPGRDALEELTPATEAQIDTTTEEAMSDRVSELTDQAPVQKQPNDLLSTHYSGFEVVGILVFFIILGAVVAYVLFGQEGNNILELLRQAQSGQSLSTAAEIITAIDDHLSQAEIPPDHPTLDAIEGMIAPLENTNPQLGAALQSWLSVSREVIAARETVITACEQEETEACTEANHQLAILEQSAARRRALVCNLTACP